MKLSSIVPSEHNSNMTKKPQTSALLTENTFVLFFWWLIFKIPSKNNLTEEIPLKKRHYALFLDPSRTYNYTNVLITAIVPNFYELVNSQMHRQNNGIIKYILKSSAPTKTIKVSMFPSYLPQLVLDSELCRTWMVRLLVHLLKFYSRSSFKSNFPAQNDIQCTVKWYV